MEQEIEHKLIEQYRKLAKTDKSALPKLATLLEHFSSALDQRHEHEAALEAQKEAVQIFRKLRSLDLVWVPRLAKALCEYGAQLHHHHQLHFEAKRALQESIRHYQQVQDNFEALAGLAESHASLAYVFGQTGTFQESINQQKQAIEQYRILAQQDGSYKETLAISLNNLGVALTQRGVHKEALAAVKEAMTIKEENADTTPEFLVVRAEHLCNIGSILSELEQFEEAISSFEEELEIHRQLLHIEPSKYIEDFAMSLLNLAALFQALGKTKEGLLIVEEGLSSLALQEIQKQTVLSELEEALTEKRRQLRAEKVQYN